MEVFYTSKSQKSILLIVKFVESKNTKNSGKRFALKLESFIKKYAMEKVEYALCYNEVLSSLGYSCIVFNNWVIAFKIKGNKFIVYRIIWGGLLL